jgi:peptidoglycan/xylan/chitin deacetylase (PgdA/CDA1 family)
MKFKTKLIASITLAATLFLQPNITDASTTSKTQGTVTFIFDDGNKSILDNAYPIFKKNGYKASVAVHTNGIGTRNHLTKTDLKKLNNEGWEILSHGVSHKPFRKMNQTQINEELRNSKKVLNTMGIKVRGFVAPYSYMPTQSFQKLSTNYEYSFSGYVDSRTQPVQKLIANAKNRNTIVRANMEGKTLEELKAYIDYAHANKVWLVLYEHNVGIGKSISKNDLDQLLKYSKQKNISVRSASQVYGKGKR